MKAVTKERSDKEYGVRAACFRRHSRFNSLEQGLPGFAPRGDQGDQQRRIPFSLSHLHQISQLAAPSDATGPEAFSDTVSSPCPLSSLVQSLFRLRRPWARNGSEERGRAPSVPATCVTRQLDGRVKPGHGEWGGPTMTSRVCNITAMT